MRFTTLAVDPDKSTSNTRLKGADEDSKCRICCAALSSYNRKSFFVRSLTPRLVPRSTALSLTKKKHFPFSIRRLTLRWRSTVRRHESRPIRFALAALRKRREPGLSRPQIQSQHARAPEFAVRGLPAQN